MPAGPLITLVGVAGTGLASFLPWARSGDRLRNSYDLIAVVDRLDLLPDAISRPSAAWYFLPLCVVLTCISVFLHRLWCSTVLSLTVGLAALGLAVSVIGSPLGVGIGAQVAVVTGLLSVVGALIVVAGSRGGRRDRGAPAQVGPA